MTDSRARLRSTKFLPLGPTLGLMITLSAGLMGCESEEDRSLAAAQTCLDVAQTSADASTCLALIESHESKAAYHIRCSANFIAQGFTGSRMASAFERLAADDGNGPDPFINLMAFLVFSKDDLPDHTVDKTVENCAKSGVRSLERLSTAAQLATLIAGTTPSGLESFDPTDPDLIANMEDAIDSLALSTPLEVAEQVGAIALSMDQSFCNEDSSFEDEEICAYLDESIEGAENNAELGTALLGLLSEHTTN